VTAPRRSVRLRRWLPLAGAVVRATPGVLRAPLASARSRRRIVVRAAADVLTALGVRVEVHASPVAWPIATTGDLVVGNRICWVDDLALLTVVPEVPVADRGRSPVGRLGRRVGAVRLDQGGTRNLPGAVVEVTAALRAGTTVTVRPEGAHAPGLGRFRPAFFQAAVDTGAPVCPFAVRYRAEEGPVPGPFADGPLWRGARAVLATRGLVVEVHLLPPLEPAGTGRRELAVLAEYAVAGVLEPPGRLPARVAAR
jgi:1-acyl-sn-glycerol-3-phosphate acyltransferase